MIILIYLLLADVCAILIIFFAFCLAVFKLLFAFIILLVIFWISTFAFLICIFAVLNCLLSVSILELDEIINAGNVGTDPDSHKESVYGLNIPC